MSYDIDQLNRVEPAYLGAYGLTEAPFSQNHDERFTYISSDLAEQLDLLKHYTQYGNLLLLVNGERGIGKSTLINYMTATAPEEWQVCHIQAHTMMDSGLLLRQVANGFGISEPPLDPGALIEVLNSQLEHLHNQSFEPILIIDDAHELPQDALKSLLYLAEHHPQQQNILRIILFCEPEIETMLEDPAIQSLKERVTHNITLPTLTEEQTAEYLRHRLAVAGLDGTSPFTPKLVNKIYKASGGLPSLINDYAHENLSDDKEPIVNEAEDLDYDHDAPAKHLTLRNMIIGAITLVMVITGLIYQEEINKLFEVPDTTQPEVAGVLNEDTTRYQTETQPFTQNDNEIESTPEVSQNTKTIDTEPTGNLDPSPSKTFEFNLNEKQNSAEKQNQQEQIPETKSEDSRIIIASVNPSPVPASAQRQIISLSGKGFHKRQSVKVSWTGNEKILSNNQVNVSSDTFLNLTISVGTTADTWQVQITDPLLNTTSNIFEFKVVADNKPAQTSTRQPVKTRQTDTTGENTWIFEQNKNHYTIQILGSHQQPTIQKYINKYKLGNKAKIFKSVRNNRDWYTLIYGSYPDKNSAQSSAKRLPGSVKSPWIRSFASIQQSLDKNAEASSAEKSNPVKALAPANQNQPITNPESWLWSQDPRHYTLQLAAGSNKSAIESFIKQHKLEGKATYFQRKRDGKDWYILIYGSYDGYSKAQKAISSLPDAVQKVKPWTRSFSAIHAELN